MFERRAFLRSLAASTFTSQASPSASGSRVVHRQPLQGVFAGLDAAYVEVVVAPGVATTAHHHSGFVLGYVLEGEYSFAIDGQSPRIVPAGGVFYEPPGATHTTSVSATAGKTARILALIVGPAGAPVTTVG